MKKLTLALITVTMVAATSTNRISKKLSENKITNDTITITHLGYKTLYSQSLHYPLLVQWWVSKSRISCNQIDRKDQFAPDPLLEKESDLQSEYNDINKLHESNNLKSLDRGHMCPAADNQCSLMIGSKKISAKKFQTECFYFTNMAPQYHSLNAGDWKKLEDRTRELAQVQDSIYIWCGSIGSQEVVNGLHVPTKCWKVIYIKKTKIYEYYIFDNSPQEPVGLEACKIKKQELEKLTGFKFNL